MRRSFAGAFVAFPLFFGALLPGWLPAQGQPVPRQNPAPRENPAAAAQAAAQQAPIRFQSAGGAAGSAAIKETVRLVNVSGGGGTAAPQASGQGGAGIPFGIAAASPFLALFGKMIKDKSEDR